jgi:hypothetical protein
LWFTHAADDRFQEVPVEDQPEVLDGVVAGLVRYLRVGQPLALVLVEQQLIPVGEIEAKAFIEGVDDLREGFQVRQVLDSGSVAGIGLYFAGPPGQVDLAAPPIWAAVCSRKCSTMIPAFCDRLEGCRTRTGRSTAWP